MREASHGPFGAVVSLITDKITTRKDPSKPYIGLENIASGTSALISHGAASDSKSTNNVFRTGDILFGKLRPRLRKCVRVDFDGYCSTDILVLRPSGSVNGRFAGFLAQSNAVFKEAIRTEEGTKMPRCSWKDLTRANVFCPEVPEQAAVANILASVDSAIEQTEALIAKTQHMKTGLMHDLFTRGVLPDGRLRPLREHAPHLYKKSLTGWIPIEWDTPRAEERLLVIDPQPDHRTPPAVLEGYPYIGIGDISTAGQLLTEGARRVSRHAFVDQVNSFDIFPGAFIFGKIGTLGESARIPSERTFAVSANVVLVTSPDRPTSDFAFWSFRSQHVARQVVDATNTTSQPALGIRSIRAFRVPWPCRPSEAALITTILDGIEAAIQCHTESLTSLHGIKRGLAHDLLTGAVRIPLSREELATARV